MQLTHKFFFSIFRPGFITDKMENVSIIHLIQQTFQIVVLDLPSHKTSTQIRKINNILIFYSRHFHEIAKISIKGRFVMFGRLQKVKS